MAVHRPKRSGTGRGAKITSVIKDIIIRQKDFVLHVAHISLIEAQNTVRELPYFWYPKRRTHQNIEVTTVRNFQKHGNTPCYLFLKIRKTQKISWRIAGQAQFWKHNQISTLKERLIYGICNQVRIAFDIPKNGI